MCIRDRFWRTPLILPLILEQVPEYGVSSLKLLIFALSLTIFLSLILHYIVLVYRAITDTSAQGPKVIHRSAQEERVTSLMGRSNASNTIVSSKKRQ